MNPSTNISTLSTPDLLNATIGLFLPPFIAVLQQPRWPKWFRALLTAFICIVIAVARCWQMNQIDPRDLLRTILIVLITTLATYEGFWQKTVAPAIENATSAAATATGNVASSLSAFFAALPVAVAAAKANTQNAAAGTGVSAGQDLTGNTYRDRENAGLPTAPPPPPAPSAPPAPVSSTPPAPSVPTSTDAPGTLPNGSVP